MLILSVLKDKAVNLAVRVLTTFKSSEIEPAVKGLDSRSLDILMKYIYRGFEFPSDNSSASLLAWHEKVTCNIHMFLGVAISLAFI